MKADTAVINFRLEGQDALQIALIKQGYFVQFLSQNEVDVSGLEVDNVINAKGQLMLPGLIETHVHLDKACTVSRCQLHQGTLKEAIEQTAALKQAFTYDDVYQRGKRVLEKAITQGTSYMRTHVEIDPVIGLIGFNAIKQLKQDYAWAITLELCVFPQEGLHNNPGTYDLLVSALEQGADLLGGCPYTDSDPEQQIRTLFALAVEYDVDLDFHLDFDLDSSSMSLPHVLEMTREFEYQDRVTVGHVTKLSALKPDYLAEIAKQMVSAGVRLTALPSTDLFLNGREYDHLVPRGVAPLLPLSAHGVCCSVSSNNIENPFTPYGDASQVRQANLYANIAQLGTPNELRQCFEWISGESAKIMRLADYGIGVGKVADVVFFDANAQAEVVATIQPPSMGLKRGAVTFTRQKTMLKPPQANVADTIVNE
ncbi:amidohydrolase family protein [Vibrio sp. EJY3]|uniref:amidohydrolase family protein n=1 Tax=Vibrio sp. (strain EJY3) TaxID=1116375 RepID=UPI000243B64A|nr:amidohydrolase family protein [Vibrio sp. EJY3]AEX23719.1 amidohydrolase 3 [Vibrio sp. EJY3]